MYRDDTCAVCGEALPPDHFYCRGHAAEVDDRLHEVGEVVPRMLSDLERVATLLDELAGVTWDYVAEQEPGDPQWPPVPRVELRADADQVEFEVDREPGYVRARIGVPLAQLLTALHAGLDTPELRRMAAACRAAEGAGATH